MNTIFWYVGMADAAIVLLAGLYVAGMFLVGRSTEYFFDRVLPAVATIIGTSFASACVVYVTRYMFS